MVPISTTSRAILVNGRAQIVTGSTLIDTDGNGSEDATLQSLLAGNAGDDRLALSERRANGTFDLYFMGSTSSVTSPSANALYVVTIPEPTSLVLLAGTAAVLLGSRRSAGRSL